MNRTYPWVSSCLRNPSQPTPALFTPIIILCALIGLILSPLGAHASASSAGQSSEPISTFSVSDGLITSVVFSPDGRLLALESSHSATTVELWDVSTGKSIANFPAQGPVWAAAFSPDGKLLALAPSDGTGAITLWDMSSEELHVTTVSAHEKDEYSPQDPVVVSRLSFSPDGKLLASGGASDTLVKLWDVSSGKHVATVSKDNSTILSVVFSPDGRLLASLDSGGTVKLWDVSSGKHVATISAHEDGGWDGLSFSSDGRLLASAGSRWSPPRAEWSDGEAEEDSEVKLWDVSTGKSIATLSGSAPVSFSPNGGLLASASAAKISWVMEEDGSGSGDTSGGQEVKLWNVSTGESIATLLLSDNSWGRRPDTVVFSPDGRLLASRTSRTVELWDVSEWTPTSQTLTRSSGDGQQGRAGATLAAPFVVSVSDQYDSPLAGTVVSFSVTAGGGTLASTTATTDANGHARSTLTLGSDLGTNTVTASVAGLDSITFTATTVEQVPHSLTKVSGDGQQGQAGEQLAKPFVVLVLDEDGAAMARVSVTFTVTGGGGTMSSTTAMTSTYGRAARTLTLGDEPGTNTVAVSVAGLDPVTFTATAVGEEPAFDLSDLFGKRVALPDNTQLLQNAPNPFNSQTIVSYFLLEPGPVRLEVFALSGQRIAVLDHGPQQAGYHRLSWDGRDAAGRSVASGTYLYRLVTDEVVLTRKLVLLR